MFFWPAARRIAASSAEVGRKGIATGPPPPISSAAISFSTPALGRCRFSSGTSSGSISVSIAAAQGSGRTAWR